MSNTTTLRESTLRQHLVTCLRTGGPTLRDRVKTPPMDFPVTVLPFELLDVEVVLNKTGTKLTLQPGCWVYSQEADQPEQWDANNLTTIWLFEGRPGFWRYLTKTGVIDEGSSETHLLGFVGDGNGLQRWGFTIPRDFTVNKAVETVCVYGDAAFIPDPEQQTYMFMDMQVVGAFIAHLSRDDLPVPEFTLGNFATLGFAPLLDEMLSVNSEVSLNVVASPDNLLRVPKNVRIHVERTMGERLTQFEYAHVLSRTNVPVMGVLHADQDSVPERAKVIPDSVARLAVGCWVTAPLDPTDSWPIYDLVTFMFLRMTKEYWSQYPELDPDHSLVCLIANSTGLREWYYHVPIEFSLQHRETLIDIVTKHAPRDALAVDVINMEWSMICRIGFLIANGHQFERWGEFELARPETESPENWMMALLNQRSTRGF